MRTIVVFAGCTGANNVHNFSPCCACALLPKILDDKLQTVINDMTKILFRTVIDVLYAVSIFITYIFLQLLVKHTCTPIQYVIIMPPHPLAS